MKVTAFKIAIFCFFIIFPISANGGIFDEVFENQYNVSLSEMYEEMEKGLKALANKGTKAMLPYVLEGNEHLNLSTSCLGNLVYFSSGMRNLKEWALQILDATGKPQSGILSGNINMMGEYDECVSTTAMKNGKVNFRGKYCLINFRPILPAVEKPPIISFRQAPIMDNLKNASDFMKMFASRASLFYYIDYAKFGICVPSGCSDEDVTQLTNYAISKLYLKVKVEFCQVEGEIIYWTKGRIIVTSIFTFLGLVVVAGTLVDRLLQEKNRANIGLKMLMCFSLTTNFPKIASTEAAEKNLVCLNGIRSLGCFWVILAHEYIVLFAVFFANHAMQIEHMVRRFSFQIVINGFFAVDIFFFLSGFLNAYIRMKMKESGKPQPSPLKMIIHRLWRIYPAIIVAYLVFLLVNTSGPAAYGRLEIFNENCRKYWWANFLFINNFLDFEHTCMQQTWYLCCDMQLFLLSLFTLPVLIRSAKKGVILHVSLILLAWVSTMFWWWMKSFPPTFEMNRINEIELRDMVKTLNNPVIHLGPYVVGILLGYLIATKKEMKISMKNQVLGWLLSAFLCTSMLFMTKRWNSGIPSTRLESMLYGAFSKTLFIVGFAWVVFACAIGRGGFANYFLSLKIWFPLSKLTYMMYLISPFVQIYYYANLQFPPDFNTTPIVWSFVASIVITGLLSLGLSLLIESPFIALEKIIFKVRRPQEKTAPSQPPETFRNIETGLNNPN